MKKVISFLVMCTLFSAFAFASLSMTHTDHHAMHASEECPVCVVLLGSCSEGGVIGALHHISSIGHLVTPLVGFMLFSFILALLGFSHRAKPFMRMLSPCCSLRLSFVSPKEVLRSRMALFIMSPNIRWSVA